METRLKALTEELQLGAAFVETLHLRQLNPLSEVPQQDDDETAMTDTKSYRTKSSSLDHIDLGMALSYLTRLTEFSAYYGVKNCGIDFSWSLLGMTVPDAIKLSDGLKTFSLRKLTLCDRFRVSSLPLSKRALRLFSLF